MSRKKLPEHNAKSQSGKGAEDKHRGFTVHPSNFDTFEFPGGVCRICGCTETHACDTSRGPCFWVEDDLCSGPKCGQRSVNGAFLEKILKAPAIIAQGVIDIADRTTLVFANCDLMDVQGRGARAKQERIARRIAELEAAPPAGVKERVWAKVARRMRA